MLNRRDGSTGPSGTVTLLVLTAVLFWGGAVAALSINGTLSQLPQPAIAGVAALGVCLPTLTYACVPEFRRWVEAVGLRTLTALHVWRIPAALVFWSYGAQGLLPETFVRNAAWGDFAAGLLALVVVLLWVRRAGYWTFHAFGFADFMVAVGTGFWFSLRSDPQMAAIAGFPIALIPLFGVGISGATHLMAFHLLATGNGRAETGSHP